MFANLIRSSLRRNFIRYTSTSNVALPFLYDLEPKCRSCGIRLQDKDKSKPGYYHLRSNEEKEQKKITPANSTFDKYLDKLSAEDRELLLDNTFTSAPPTRITTHSGPSIHELVKKAYEIKPDETAIECVRCRNAKLHADYDLSQKEFPIHDLNTIMPDIPSGSPVVYVFSGNDFPMGINPDIFKYRNPDEVYFIMTKADNLFQRNDAARKYTLTFLTDYFKLKYDVPAKNIYVTSAKEGWNSEDLLNFIPESAYIVGNVNSGKSTLIKSLMLFQELETKQDSESKLPFPIRIKEKKKFIERFKQKVGPGISYLPGFTREFLPVTLGGIRSVFDVPGFASDPYIHEFYHKFPDGKTIAKLTEGRKTYKFGTFKSKYDSVKGPQVISLGGIGYLQLPKDSMYQIRNVTNIDYHVFSNIEKAAQVSADLPEPMKNRFILTHDEASLANLERYIIPPFYGSIELVLENIGYIHIKPIGAKKTNELMVLYLPCGITGMIRQPIVEYIQKTFKDSWEKNLLNQNSRGKKQLILKRYSKATPFASILIPTGAGEITKPRTEEYLNTRRMMDFDQVNAMTNARNAYNDKTVINENNKYEYWIEPR
ncbi:Genetic interactor of prohibitins 3 mitochondrial [Spathaspora sp. JA1]|nr:Genetic interactor of prohibitins 3 mitochondrial [Spathaspora sp. JA1]